MEICYLDEAGDTSSVLSKSPPPHITPLIVIGGLVIEQHKLLAVTEEFLNLKSRFFPNAMPPPPHHLGRVLVEIKGAELRKAARSSHAREQRAAIGFLDKLVALLEKHQMKLLSRIWVKAVGSPCNGTSVYTYSAQAICGAMQHFLATTDDYGMVIADSRSPGLNASVAHSIFTQKFKADGDEYERLYEMPTFGHSQNHVGLQLADLVLSALLFPIAAYTYCTGYVTSIHVQGDHKLLKERFAARLQRLQYRYQDPVSRKWLGGIVVSDSLAKRSAAELFREHPVPTIALLGPPALPKSALPAIAPPPVATPSPIVAALSPAATGPSLAAIATDKETQ